MWRKKLSGVLQHLEERRKEKVERKKKVKEEKEAEAKIIGLLNDRN